MAVPKNKKLPRNFHEKENPDQNFREKENFSDKNFYEKENTEQKLP